MDVLEINQIREAKLLQEAVQKTGSSESTLSEVLNAVQRLDNSAENDDKQSSWQKRIQRKISKK